MELHYARLFFRFQLQRDLADPYTLFSSRADFDAAFRRTVSCRRLDCAGCRSSIDCPYPVNFGQAIPGDPEAVRRHQKPPLPFVFEFPLLPDSPNRGVTMECSLTLVGSAIQHAGRYIEAVRLFLGALPAVTEGVEAGSPGGGRAPVGEGEHPALPLLSALDPPESGPLSPTELTVQLVTPLKLMQEGRMRKDFTFSHFARNLMRRVSSLAYHYEGIELPLDYRWLSQLSETVETVTSDCRLVSWHGRPAGILGSSRFRGDLHPFHLLLQLGLATHLGKGASFGFGCYRLQR